MTNIARLTVQRGALTEFPIAEKVRGGWQNGVTFYPDSEVTKMTPLTVRPADSHAVLVAATSEALGRYASKLIEGYDEDRYDEDEYGYDATARQAFVAGALWSVDADFPVDEKPTSIMRGISTPEGFTPTSGWEEV